MKREDAVKKHCRHIGGLCMTNDCMSWRDYSCENCDGQGKYIPPELAKKRRAEAIAEERDAVADVLELVSCEHCDGTGRSDGGHCIADDQHGHNSLCKPERDKPRTDGKIIIYHHGGMSLQKAETSLDSFC